MPKNSKKQISIDENKVINELKRNANKSINKIAKDCEFSRQKVWRIIKKLERDKVIWSYGAIVDEEKQGLNYYILLLRRGAKPVTKEAIENIVSREIEEEIRKIDCEMITSLYLHGLYDWIIIFTAPNTSQAKKVSELFRDRYQNLLDEVILLETIFPVKIQGIVNPEVEKFKTFVP